MSHIHSVFSESRRAVEHKDFTVDFAHPIDNKLATFLQSPASVDSLVIGGSLPAPPSSSALHGDAPLAAGASAVPLSPHASSKPAGGSARRPSSSSNGTAAYALPTSASRHHEVDSSSARGAMHRSRNSNNNSGNASAAPAAAASNTAAAPAVFVASAAAANDDGDMDDDDETLMGDADDADSSAYRQNPPSSYASSLSSPSHVPATFASMSPHSHAHSQSDSFDGSDGSMAGSLVKMTPSHSYDELVFGSGANAALSLPASPAPLCAPSPAHSVSGAHGDESAAAVHATTEEAAAAAVMSSIGATAALWSSEPFRPQPSSASAASVSQPFPAASAMTSSVSHTTAAASPASASAAIPYLLPTNARAGAHAAAQTEIDCAVMDTVLAAHMRARSESAAAALSANALLASNAQLTDEVAALKVALAAAKGETDQWKAHAHSAQSERDEARALLMARDASASALRDECEALRHAAARADADAEDAAAKLGRLMLEVAAQRPPSSSSNTAASLSSSVSSSSSGDPLQKHSHSQSQPPSSDADNGASASASALLMHAAPPLESLAQAFMRDLISPTALSWPSASVASSANASSLSASSSASASAAVDPFGSDAALDVVTAQSGPALVHSMRYMLVSLQKQVAQARAAEERARAHAERVRVAAARQHERELEQACVNECGLSVREEGVRVCEW